MEYSRLSAISKIFEQKKILTCKGFAVTHLDRKAGGFSRTPTTSNCIYLVLKHNSKIIFLGGGSLFSMDDLSREGGGTLPHISYKPSQDL